MAKQRDRPSRASSNWEIMSRTDKRIYYRFRILRHDVAELTVFLGDPQGLAEPGLTNKAL
jgi:hypothetical protein